MKTIIVFSMLAAFAFAKPLNEPEAGPTIVHYEYNNNGLGAYNFSFETSDGAKREESAVYANPDDPEHSSLVVNGSYSYLGPDGVLYKVQYVADENGYRVIEDDQKPQNGKL